MPKLSMMVSSFDQCSSLSIRVGNAGLFCFSANKSTSEPADLFQVVTGAKRQQPLDSNKNIREQAMDIKRACVLGGGSFGTAVANILASNGVPTSLWMRDQAQVDALNETKTNTLYLPGITLDFNLMATSSLEKAVDESDIIFVSVPSKAFRAVIGSVGDSIGRKILVSTTKGIESEGFKLMSQVLRECAPHSRIGVLSGPNLAKEIVRGHPTATVIASEDEGVRKTVQALLRRRNFRVYANPDVYGVELGGALKNIYAIVLGMASAHHVGENTRSFLLTRSLAEMSRFAVSMGANPLTFLGLAGIGDLFATCTSPLSRNYRVGMLFGQGKSLEEAVESLGQVAEGVNTVRIVKEKADEMGVYMPLLSGVYEIIYGGVPVQQVVENLTLGAVSADVDFIIPDDCEQVKHDG
jgi:glycerol-3-phosphate dehydrogenase (NAD(P)+)